MSVPPFRNTYDTRKPLEAWKESEPPSTSIAVIVTLPFVVPAARSAPSKRTPVPVGHTGFPPGKSCWVGVTAGPATS
jgi:hypothetical protein